MVITLDVMNSDYQMKCARAFRTIVVLASLVAAQGCGGLGKIDSSSVSPISNDDTYATLAYMWSGIRTAIQSKREPSVGAFNLQLSSQAACTRGGTGSYQGTLVGTKTNTTGNGTLTITGTLTDCQFDDTKATITRISAAQITVAGTIAIVNDVWGDINLRMLAPTVTVNGTACPGGVDVVLTGTSPSSRPVSTGTACGRTGAVDLP